MKRFTSLVLSLIMILSMGKVVFAASDILVLKFNNAPSYEIIIPSDTTISNATGKGVINVSLDEVKIGANSKIDVYITSDNCSGDSWYLVNEKNPDDKIEYTIGTTSGGSDIENGKVMSLSPDTTEYELHITILDRNKVGKFTDVLTFTSEIVKQT